MHDRPRASLPLPGKPGMCGGRSSRRASSFDLKGRVAVAAGNEGFNARLLWRQTGTRSNVALDGPLGAGGVQITADGPSLSVVTSRGDHLDNEAARSELAKRLGFDPPIGSLRFWVLGVPDPCEPRARDARLPAAAGEPAAGRVAGRLRRVHCRSAASGCPRE